MTAQPQLRVIMANPSMFGAMTRARPNGSLVTIAAITAVNRSPRRALLSARDDMATGIRLSLAAAVPDSNRRP
jgi:hypothetical protein